MVLHKDVTNIMQIFFQLSFNWLLDNIFQTAIISLAAGRYFLNAIISLAAD